MTQITVTLENGADAHLIRKIFENVKGVLRTKIVTHQDPAISERRTAEEIKASAQNKEWLKTLDQLYNSVDRSVVDTDDERTRYILSR